MRLPSFCLKVELVWPSLVRRSAMERKRVYKGVPDAVYDAAFGAPSKVISEDVRLQAISEVLATAMRSTSPEHVTEKQQMSELLPSLTEVFSVTVIGQAKPTGASLDWWSSENGVPKALQRAGAWGSVGASMVCSYPSDLLVCDRTAVLPPGRCRRTGDTWLPEHGVVPDSGVVPEQGRPASGVVPEQGRPAQGYQFRGSDSVVPEHTTEKAKKGVKKEPKLKKEVKKEPRSPKSPSSLVTGKSKRSLGMFQTMKAIAKSKPAPKAKEPKQRQLGFRPK